MLVLYNGDNNCLEVRMGDEEGEGLFAVIPCSCMCMSYCFTLFPHSPRLPQGLWYATESTATGVTFAPVTTEGSTAAAAFPALSPEQYMALLEQYIYMPPLPAKPQLPAKLEGGAVRMLLKLFYDALPPPPVPEVLPWQQLQLQPGIGVGGSVSGDIAPAAAAMAAVQGSLSIQVPALPAASASRPSPPLVLHPGGGGVAQPMRQLGGIGLPPHPATPPMLFPYLPYGSSNRQQGPPPPPSALFTMLRTPPFHQPPAPPAPPPGGIAGRAVPPPPPPPPAQPPRMPPAAAQQQQLAYVPYGSGQHPAAPPNLGGARPPAGPLGAAPLPPPPAASRTALLSAAAAAIALPPAQQVTQPAQTAQSVQAAEAAQQATQPVQSAQATQQGAQPAQPAQATQAAQPAQVARTPPLTAAAATPSPVVAAARGVAPQPLPFSTAVPAPPTAAAPTAPAAGGAARKLYCPVCSVRKAGFVNKECGHVGPCLQCMPDLAQAATLYPRCVTCGKAATKLLAIIIS